ncbi:MAG: hypothetical protein KDI88_06235 [Gammaproteobacteria bacterium]|nr:hypothetical protein [Gammaproteobacteria bacterium]
MFQWLKARPRQTRQLGLEFRDDGFAAAVVEPRDGVMRVVGVRWCPVRTPDERLPLLRQCLRDMDAEGLPVVATLQLGAYSLVQLEHPGLGEDELVEAMRWKVKDLIDFPVEQAVIDVFALPQSRRPGAPALLYVVVAREHMVTALSSLLQDADLEIVAVDVVEMAIRNLARMVDRPQRPRAYLLLHAGQTVIEIADAEQVYLSRRVLQDFDVGADQLLLQAQMENLALEVQRSLDYFESQYAVGAADQLTVLAGSEPAYEAFATVAERYLTVPTQRFAVDGFDGGETSGQIQQALTAVGAAMRDLPWAA